MKTNPATSSSRKLSRELNPSSGAHPASHVSGLAGAILAALYPASYVAAQEAAAERTGALEEVLVTATKRSISLQDVPQSITAFTTVDIQKNAFKNMADYVRALPSVTLINSRPGRNELTIRGISTGTGEYRTDSQVAVYLDEQPITTISQQVSPYLVDIERVESLPGPQGTLFGSSSQAGTLRIITNKPDTTAFAGEAFGEARWTDGGDMGGEANAWLNIPLAEDKAALRVVAYYNKTGGYVDNVFGEDLVGLSDNAAVVENDFNDSELYGGRIALKLDLSDKLEILANVITENGETNGSWNTDPYLGDNKIVKFFDEWTSDDWWQASLTINADLGFADLVSNSAYFERDIAYEWDNTLYSQWKDSYWGYYYGYGLYNTQYTASTIFNDQSQDRFSQEIRLTSKGEGRFQWMVGFFYEDVHDEWFYGTQNPELMNTIAWDAANYYAYYYNYYGYDVQYPLAPTTIGYSNKYDRTVKQTAVFGEMNFNITEQWMATVGARWFEYDRDVFEQNQFPQGLPPAGTYDTNGVYTSDGKESDTVFKFSTQYEFSDTKMMYFLYSQGFRLGGNNSTRAANTGLVPLTYNSDTMDNWEIGLKSEWLDRRLLINVDVFLMEWDDIMINQGSIDNKWWLNGTFNGSKGRQKGLEMNFSWYPTPQLLFQGSMTLTDPEYSDAFTMPDGTVVPAGTPMPISPESAFWGAVEYNFANWHPFGGDFWLRYDQNYQDTKWNSLNTAVNRDVTGRMDSHSVANFQVGLNLPSQWDMTFFVRNVWNETAMTWLDNGSDYIPEWFGDPRFRNMRSFLPPRTIGINVRKRF
jgi:outer membrane receptor protein involved in Fe transport